MLINLKVYLDKIDINKFWYLFFMNNIFQKIFLLMWCWVLDGNDDFLKLFESKFI